MNAVASNHLSLNSHVGMQYFKDPCYANKVNIIMQTVKQFVLKSWLNESYYDSHQVSVGCAVKCKLTLNVSVIYNFCN